MNKVQLIGRVVSDAELRFTPGTGNGVTTITIAVDKYNSKTQQKEADFIGVTIWGKTAESLSPYLVKGTQVAISGRIQTRSYEAKDGSKKYVTEVVADNFGGVELLGGKKQGQDIQGSNNFGNMNQDLESRFDGELEIDNSGDCPF